MTVPVDFAPGKMFRAEWPAASTQSVGTVLFNVSTGAAPGMSHTIAAEKDYMWNLDAAGSVAFLLSGVFVLIAFVRVDRFWDPGKVDWWSGQINFAGCVAFGVAAVAAFITAAGSSLDPRWRIGAPSSVRSAFLVVGCIPCPGHRGRRHRRRGLPWLASRTPQHSLRRRRHEVRHHELRLISGPEFIRYEESHRDAVAMLKVDLERIPAVMGCSVDGDGKRPQCASIVPLPDRRERATTRGLDDHRRTSRHAGHPVAIFLNGHQEGVNRPRLREELPCATASTSSNNESTSSVAVGEPDHAMPRSPQQDTDAQ